MKKIVFGFLTLVVLTAPSCIKNNSPACDSTYDACANPAPASEIATLESWLASSNITATKHCSGVYYQIVNPGSGAKPNICSAITINYKGTLTNGYVFDQSQGPTKFNLIRLIEGWKKTLPLISKGGSIKMFIPPSLGYGSMAYGSIPANSILIFDITLVDVS